MPLVQNKKIAIVLSGGGTTCAYQVGVLEALTQYYKAKPDILVGSSGSAGTIVYYTAGQFETIKHIWLELLSTRAFVFFLRLSKIMDIDYLVDIVFKKEAPLDVARLRAATIQYFIAATRSDDGRVQWFTNGAEDNIFEILRASKAIPIAYNKKVTINQVQYIDGYIGATFEGSIQKAESAGADIIIAINNSVPRFWVRTISLKIYGFFNPTVQNTIDYYLNTLQKKNFYTRPETQLIVLRPGTQMPITHPLQNDRATLHAQFERGYADAINNAKLRSLFL